MHVFASLWSVSLAVSAPLIYLWDHMGIISVYSLLSSSLPNPSWHSPVTGRHCQGGPPHTRCQKTGNKSGMERRSLPSAWLLRCCFLTNCYHLCSDKCYFGVCHFAGPSETHSYTHTYADSAHPSSKTPSKSQHAAGNCLHF